SHRHLPQLGDYQLDKSKSSRLPSAPSDFNLWGACVWWRLALATLVGICIGLAAPTLPRSYFHKGTCETGCTGYFHLSWPSTGKKWPEFANWLRHGGRMLYLGRAFTVAKRGLNEDEVRAVLGPPDLVFVGADELAGFRQTNRPDAAGA